jgi:hypothetical protein
MDGDQQINRKAVQEELLEVFRRHELDVAVGIAVNGIVIRSQDKRVDATNIGIISLQPDRANPDSATD